MISLFVSVAMMTCLFVPAFADSAPHPVAGEQESASEERVVLYSAQAITDTAALERRAAEKVDDLQERRGISLKCAVDAPEEFAANVGYTTQLVSAYEVDGVLCEEYAISVVAEVVDNERNTNSTTSNGYKLTTTVWFRWHDIVHYQYSFVESTAHYIISGSPTSTPTSLGMGNKIYTGWITNQTYLNSNTFSPQANTTYRLASPSTGIFELEGGTYIYSEVHLILRDGTDIKVWVSGADGVWWPDT